MLDFDQARRNMVDCQLRTYDVTDHATLTAISSVARESFVPETMRELAYLDRALPLGPANRNMLTPMVFARLLQAAEISKSDRVLDIGCGLGYSSAVLARLAGSVVAVEDDAGLVAEAKARLSRSGYDSVGVVQGALNEGATNAGLFDVIVVNGAFDVEPVKLLGQLKDGGRLVGISRQGAHSQARLFLRDGNDFGSRVLFDASAMPLPGFEKAEGFVF